MTWEAALTPTLEQTLNLILSSLANFFGTTTTEIMANAPQWLAKYGWYVTLHHNLGVFLALGLVLGIILAGIFLFAWNCLCEKDITGKTLAIASLVMLVTIAVFGVVTILPCVFAPEVVGLEAAIKLLSPGGA